MGGPSHSRGWPGSAVLRRYNILERALPTPLTTAVHGGTCGRRATRAVQPHYGACPQQSGTGPASPWPRPAPLGRACLLEAARVLGGWRQTHAESTTGPRSEGYIRARHASPGQKTRLRTQKGDGSEQQLLRTSAGEVDAMFHRRSPPQQPVLCRPRPGDEADGDERSGMEPFRRLQAAQSSRDRHA